MEKSGILAFGMTCEYQDFRTQLKGKSDPTQSTCSVNFTCTRFMNGSTPRSNSVPRCSEDHIAYRSGNAATSALYSSYRINPRLIVYDGVKKLPSFCVTPWPPWNHDTRSFVNCSILGFNFVSCKLKSSTVPILNTLIPGKPLLTLFINVPHTEQNWFSMLSPVAIDLLCDHFDSLSVPRIHSIA